MVTFKSKMIVTFGPWLKGRVLGQHTCPYGLYDERRRTTTTTTKQALRALCADVFALPLYLACLFYLACWLAVACWHPPSTC